MDESILLLVANGRVIDSSVKKEGDSVIEFDSLVKVKRRVENSLAQDFLPKIAPNQDQGMDNLGKGKPLFSAFSAQSHIIPGNVFLGGFTGDPTAKLAVDAKGSIIELDVIELLVGGQAHFPADIGEPVVGQLGRVPLDEVNELLKNGEFQFFFPLLVSTPLS